LAVHHRHQVLVQPEVSVRAFADRAAIDIQREFEQAHRRPRREVADAKDDHELEVLVLDGGIGDTPLQLQGMRSTRKTETASRDRRFDPARSSARRSETAS
jgi:hypothetical protein